MAGMLLDKTTDHDSAMSKRQEPDPYHCTNCTSPVSLAMTRRLSDHRAVAAALARHAGRRAAAARELGVSRQGLAKLIMRLNVQEPVRVQAPDV